MLLSFSSFCLPYSIISFFLSFNSVCLSTTEYILFLMYPTFLVVTHVTIQTWSLLPIEKLQVTLWNASISLLNTRPNLDGTSSPLTRVSSFTYCVIGFSRIHSIKLFSLMFSRPASQCFQVSSHLKSAISVGRDGVLLLVYVHSSKQ